MSSENELRTGVTLKGDLGDLRIEEINDDRGHSTEHTNRSDALSQISSGLVHTSMTPVFGNVAVTNSDNVQFGNNTYFNGHVTIKQIVNKSGIENNAFEKSEDEYSRATPDNQNNITLEKSLKCKIQVWQVIAFFSVSAIVLSGICAIALIYSKSNQVTTNDGSFSTDSEDYDCLTLVEDYFNSTLTYLLILALLMLFTPITLLAYVFLVEKCLGIYLYLHACIIWMFIKNRKIEINADKEEQLLIAQKHLRIVTRDDWLAQPVVKPLDPIIKPIPWIIIAHTATYGCNSQSECVLRVRLIQNFHIESKRWYDIGYNFLVGGDGSVYVGRGWDYIGAHTLGYNNFSLGVAVIGTYTQDPPPKRQMDALQKLLDLGVELGKIKSDYILFAHKNLASTTSPGEGVYNVIKTWPHFVKNASDIDALIPKHPVQQ